MTHEAVIVRRAVTSAFGRAVAYLQEFPLRVFGRLMRDGLTLAIRAKWARDSRRLPLTPEHWELYDIIHRKSWEKTQSLPNLVRPTSRNDAINWAKLFDQRFDCIICCDKIRVRDYIRDRVGEQYLVTLYQVHEHFADIDFDALPSAFVIKTNHDSGTVILVRDKATFDRAAAEAQVEAALRRPFGWENGEWAYAYIPPRVFVEELLDPDSDVPPADYKFSCFGGYATHAVFIYDRGRTPKSQRIQRDGTLLIRKPRKSMYPQGSAFQKPPEWGAMVALADTLGKDFKLVRVDLYLSGGRIYVGELTLWSAAGFLPNGTPLEPEHLARVDFTTYRPLLIPELERTQSRFMLYPSARRSPD
jgi:hypothetical protein